MNPPKKPQDPETVDFSLPDFRAQVQMHLYPIIWVRPLLPRIKYATFLSFSGQWSLRTPGKIEPAISKRLDPEHVFSYNVSTDDEEAKAFGICPPVSVLYLASTLDSTHLVQTPAIFERLREDRL